MALVALLTLLIFTFILSKASSLVVNNASKLARFFGISQLAIGFLLIAVSTSLPELAVSVASSSAKEGAIAAGNVFGSNIANILLILGIGAFLYGIRIGREELKDISIILVLTTIISAYIIFAGLVRNEIMGFLEGIILLLLFGGYAIYIFTKKRVDMDGIEKIPKKEALHAFLFFCLSIIVVLISSGFVVESAVSLARGFNLAESFIGATIIAIGTSLPELSIDLQALRKKHYGLALGD